MHKPSADPGASDERLLELLEHPVAAARLGAVEELARRARSSSEAVARAARSALLRMLDDDSKRVSDAARTALADLAAEGEREREEAKHREREEAERRKQLEREEAERREREEAERRERGASQAGERARRDAFKARVLAVLAGVGAVIGLIALAGGGSDTDQQGQRDGEPEPSVSRPEAERQVAREFKARGYEVEATCPSAGGSRAGEGFRCATRDSHGSAWKMRARAYSTAPVAVSVDPLNAVLSPASIERAMRGALVDQDYRMRVESARCSGGRLDADTNRTMPCRVTLEGGGERAVSVTFMNDYGDFFVSSS